MVLNRCDIKLESNPTCRTVVVDSGVPQNVAAEETAQRHGLSLPRQRSCEVVQFGNRLDFLLPGKTLLLVCLRIDDLDFKTRQKNEIAVLPCRTVPFLDPRRLQTKFGRRLEAYTCPRRTCVEKKRASNRERDWAASLPHRRGDGFRNTPRTKEMRPVHLQNTRAVL